MNAKKDESVLKKSAQTILIVDDDPGVVRLVGALLKDHGYNV